MGFLSPDYYANALKDTATSSAAGPSPTPAPVAQAAPITIQDGPSAPVPTAAPAPAAAAPADSQVIQPGDNTAVLDKNPYLDVAKRLGPLGVIGGLLGSFGGPIGAAAGATAGASIGASIQYPDQAKWDSMNLAQKAGFIGGQALVGTVKMIANLPSELIKAPIRYGLSVGEPWVKLAQGKDADLGTLQNESVTKLPVLGAIPTYYQSFKQARDSGMGPLASALFTGGTALGDITIGAGIAEAGAKAFQPRSPIAAPVESTTVRNVEPVRSQIIRDNGGKVTGINTKSGESPAEYYSLPKSTASQFGGKTGNTFLKITPASPDTVEVSVVQSRSGLVPSTIDRLSGTKVTTGDFGPEVKIQSQIVPLRGEGADFSAGGEAPTGSIPSNVVKGRENAPITGSQLANLGKIGEANGIAPSLRDAVIRTVTGKDVMGEMTQAEYVKAAQTLGLFNEADKYTPAPPFLNPATQYFSPQRYWMRDYEQRSGIPLYSEVYKPMEDAVSTRDVFRNAYREKARQVFGDYADPSKGAERVAINAYLRGDKTAIEGNPAFDAKTQTDLVSVATDLRKLYDEIGPKLDVPPEIFLKDYSPNIQNIGGIYQLYKEGSQIPKELDFFAKFKRKGNFTAPQIDDALALFDIYTNAGSNRMFLNPVLERIGKVTDSMPKTVHNSVRSYVLEKMGYAGRLEQAADEMVPAINKKLGVNLPPDAARQFSNVLLSTQYSGLLSSPATWFRQMFQYPLFGYARLGPKFAAEAYGKALSEEGMKEVRDNGFLVSLGVPHGEEIAQDTTLGGSLVNRYKNLTQATISPNSFADNVGRAVVYHQTKLQFEDALGRYNAGKISWQQFEKEMDFDALSPVDRNMIRQKLVAGDTKGAFLQLARDVVDETQFPYRKATGSRVGYGLAGKITMSLMQWPTEAAHTLGSWMAQGARTGDFSKVIRYAAASSAIYRTFKEAYGVDFSRSLFLGPFNNFYSPFVQTAMNTIDALTAGINNQRQQFNDNRDQVVRTLQSAGMPAGVEVQNVQNFNRSLKAGPDENGQYGVYDAQGNLRYRTDFAGIFFGNLLGFPIDKRISDANLVQDMKNAQVDQSTAKQRVLELLQQQKFDEASQLMANTGVKVTPQDMDNYYIPLTERTFQSLPASLKAQFAPRVYPEAYGLPTQ